MRIISRRPLRLFSELHPDSRKQLEAWFYEVRRAHWQNANELSGRFASASILKGGRVIFNICGNRYRLVVWINFERQLVLIRFVGTHLEYDKIDAESI